MSIEKEQMILSLMKNFVNKRKYLYNQTLNSNFFHDLEKKKELYEISKEIFQQVTGFNYEQVTRNDDE